MRSSQYFRAQANLYRDIALLMTDPSAAKSAIATAAQYQARADEMEKIEHDLVERVEG
jgi:hypothetical protein